MAIEELQIVPNVGFGFGVPPKKRTWSCSNFLSKLDWCKIA
ncbi:hypothetical protein LEP1GSC062_0506 [Leptospira alexanderi serovar Manhao 3 str. L 60]|uniref:Uncharacterized protein n=1 Tax=Leptospira alexanderi serovar Manhao 3 str. L 60 TaxID=1049759 RepID=V6IG47_9LEPT|nr:hypothetical protein LEP1GSC062_0506 [Leptospira alexanderi serovar Manhao 3 str. L 60]